MQDLIDNQLAQMLDRREEKLAETLQVRSLHYIPHCAPTNSGAMFKGITSIHPGRGTCVCTRVCGARCGAARVVSSTSQWQRAEPRGLAGDDGPDA